MIIAGISPKYLEDNNKDVKVMKEIKFVTCSIHQKNQ